MIKTQNFTMKSDFKNAKKYMEVLSNILFMNSLPLTCDAICSKLYRDRENILVPFCQTNILYL